MNKVKTLYHKLDLTKKSLVGIALYVALLLFYCSYKAMGLVNNELTWITPFFIICMIGMIVVLVLRRKIIAHSEDLFRLAKPFLCIALIIMGYFLVERPYNPDLFNMESYYAFVNVGIVAILFLIIYLAGQQSKASAFVFLGFCFIVGLANYFVIEFKGQPVIPSDLFALSTAAAVSGGYDYIINDNVVEALIGLAFGCLLVLFLPKARFSRRTVAVNCSVTLVIAGMFGYWLNNYDISEVFDIKVDPWYTSGSYSSQGTVACFIKLSQDVKPKEPSDYSHSGVIERLSSYETVSTDYSHSLEEAPSVVVIMNETFSDMSLYEGIFDDYEGPAYYNSISDAVVKGDAFVSALGGGTCNSEFEFLTGSTMGILGGGVYPYVMYGLDNCENLAAYFNTFNYDTTAIHPAEASNWRRNSVYENLGFDTFYDIEEYEDAEVFRDKTSDKATYETVLDILKTTDAPQFIFDVTIQNHSGYDTYLVDEEDLVHAPIKGEENDAVNEFLSCIEQSDRDLEFLINELNELDRPVILCFFGDHQPYFNTWLSEIAYEKEVTEFELEEIQARFTVPYMIWANYELELPTEAVEISESLLQTTFDTEEAGTQTAILTHEPKTTILPRAEYIEQNGISLNYLGATLAQLTGLPLTSYQQYQLEAYQYMPVINLNGYRDYRGLWYWHHQDSEVLWWYYDYARVQYDSLFNKANDKPFATFAQNIASSIVYR